MHDTQTHITANEDDVDEVLLSLVLLLFALFVGGDYFAGCLGESRYVGRGDIFICLGTHA